MNPDKIAARLTDEILKQPSPDYDFINARVHMGIAAGVTLGRAHLKTKQAASLGKNGKIVKVYESIKQAANDVDGDSSAISKICLGKI